MASACSFHGVVVTNSNKMILDALPGDYESYFSSDTLKEAEQVPPDAPEQTPNYLTMLTHPNTPSHRLDLKIGAVCAIQQSLSVEKGLVHRSADSRDTGKALPASHYIHVQPTGFNLDCQS
ncbi:uncharacterized protein HD556DRAFT_1443955 [Suillus plorans]|uniref:Uncharacterized protein n=1 Tax=Suillus plorans TaxID=116603 RepID=A0A9P7DHM0_9AGAM|nr:uncharacterized protein HD556DRAFT_1443955 [Suillus plorans]KAG1793207.1 hypothetical protein HD556DRAFT_1443955 [Suillus plorans]